MHTDGGIYSEDIASSPRFDIIQVTQESYEQEVINGLWMSKPFKVTNGVSSIIFRYYRPEGSLIEREDIAISYNGGYQDYQFAVGDIDTYPTDDTEWFDAPPTLPDGKYLWMRTKWTGKKD